MINSMIFRLFETSMNDKHEFFSQLPLVLKSCIGAFVPTNDATAFAATCKATFFALQQPHALPMPHRKIMHFLNKIIQREHELVKRLLQEDIYLLCKKTKLRDLSGREFDAISGFEYALWALDKYQWEDMLACLPKDAAGHLTEKGRYVATAMLDQYRQVKAQGLRYTLNGESKTEPHYDFAIIAALQEQVSLQNAPGAKNWNAIDAQWRTRVGGAQRLLPGHVVDEYCSNTPFFPIPTFLSRPQPANGLHQFHNWSSNAWESWDGVNSEIGINFSIYKGETAAGRGSAWVRGEETVAGDLSAMTALCETRTRDFNALEARLASLLAVEEQLQPGI